MMKWFAGLPVTLGLNSFNTGLVFLEDAPNHSNPPIPYTSCTSLWKISHRECMPSHHSNIIFHRAVIMSRSHKKHCNTDPPHSSIATRPERHGGSVDECHGH
ncbi:hypothetical protein EX30DRAFT_91157 [Ascodesmis nigricans]|uniref:Uncharacterized protein n=1 Tax=Ascodesmis nigricans TaxID=341454 RepID=A0A4S2N3Q6_9PEZI|nr:hypothetical protein EX30DRAFT_91157 [Ascodesmis nigricans]